MTEELDILKFKIQKQNWEKEFEVVWNTRDYFLNLWHVLPELWGMK